jgi:hypothetical protein
MAADSISLNGKNVDFVFSVPFNDLIGHLANRSDLSEKKILDLLNKNPKIQKKYLDLVLRLTKGIVANELDELQDIIDFAEKL